MPAVPRASQTGIEHRSERGGLLAAASLRARTVSGTWPVAGCRMQEMTISERGGVSNSEARSVPALSFQFEAVSHEPLSRVGCKQSGVPATVRVVKRTIDVVAAA